MFKQTTDEELMQLIADCRAEKRRAQHRFFKLFYSEVMAVCMRYAKDEDEAQDMLSEGFIKIFANLDKFAEGSFKAWMKRVVVNAAIDYQRKYKTLTQTTDIEEVGEVEIQNFDENTALSKITTDELLALIQQLPPATRSVFNLYVFEGYPHAEIAKILQMKEGTSHWHLNFARTKLKEMIHEITK